MKSCAFTLAARSAIGIATLATASLANADAVLAVSPSAAGAPPSTTSVAISATNLARNSAIGGFQLELGYNAAVWTPSSVQFGQFLGDVASFEALTSSDFSTTGVVKLSEVSLIGPFDPLPLSAIQPAAGTPFSLATVSFTAVGAGTGQFRVSGAQLTDAFGASIGVVPEPGTWALFAVGAAVLVPLGRRRDAARRQCPSKTSSTTIGGEQL